MASDGSRNKFNRMFSRTCNMHTFGGVLFKTTKKPYDYPMDDRKKQIGELERQKKEQAVHLDSLLSQFGETLFGRAAGSQPKNSSSFGELADYRRFQDDIAVSQTSIQTVEEQIRRFRELEEGIEAREREESTLVQDLAFMQGSLGKLLFDAAEDSADYAELCAPCRDQIEALLAKIDSLEERLAALEQREGGNVFIWIGKSAQSLVQRTFLTRAQENLEQLYRNLAERYGSEDGTQFSPPDENSEIGRLYAETGQKREELLAISHDLNTLRNEKKNISGSFNAEGGPLRQIQNLKKHIARTQGELNALYMRVGAEAASVNAGGDDVPAKRRQFFNANIHAEDQEILDNAAQTSASIRNAEEEIEKLRAAIAIDDERAKIGKYQKMILDRKEKIVQAKKSIAELEANILNSEANIKKLQDLL